MRAPLGALNAQIRGRVKRLNKLMRVLYWVFFCKHLTHGPGVYWVRLDKRRYTDIQGLFVFLGFRPKNSAMTFLALRSRQEICKQCEPCYKFAGLKYIFKFYIRFSTIILVCLSRALFSLK